MSGFKQALDDPTNDKPVWIFLGGFVVMELIILAIGIALTPK